MSTIPSDLHAPISITDPISAAKSATGNSRRRDRAAILERMHAQALSEGQSLPLSRQAVYGSADRYPADIGLLLGQLEDRWSVDSSLARSFLSRAGLPYDPRQPLGSASTLCPAVAALWHD